MAPSELLICPQSGDRCDAAPLLLALYTQAEALAEICPTARAVGENVVVPLGRFARRGQREREIGSAAGAGEFSEVIAESLVGEPVVPCVGTLCGRMAAAVLLLGDGYLPDGSVFEVSRADSAE